MASESLGQKATKGAIWASVDRFGSMGIQFIVNLILARILLPADFGIIGMLTIFIAVSQTLIDGGFGSALIQKKHPTQTDYSTIFFWNLILAVFLYIILYFLSPYIAIFYSMPQLTDVLRVMALTLIITGIYAIQKTRLQKMLAFRSITIVNLSAYTLGAGIAVIMAKNNFGVWSLVSMQLSYGIISIILIGLVTHWFPSICFSKKSIKELFGFGGFIMAANILQTVCQNLQGLIIGKRFSATQMGYFSQAYKLDQITSYSIPQVIVQVMYPVYASIQDDRERLNNMVLMNMRIISFIVYPILAVLILIADPLIEFLYGDKWIPSASYFKILCVGGFFVCLQNLNFYAVAAVGKSKSLFKWSFYKWGFLIVALLIGMEIGMNGILWGLVLSSANIYFTNLYLSYKHTGLSIKRQLSTIIPILIGTILSFCVSIILSWLYHNSFLEVSLLLCIYLLFGKFFYRDAIFDIKTLICHILQ